METLISILSFFYILFLPGFFLSFIFFKHQEIDVIERLALSFGLSIAVVPIVVFYSNLLGIPITAITVILQITAILFLTGIILLIQQFVKRK